MAARKRQSNLEKELYLAVLDRDVRKVKKRLKRCDGTFTDNYGNTLLHLYSTPEITKMLIKKTNVDLNARNKDGQTPLRIWFHCVSGENDEISVNWINQTEFDRHKKIVECLLQEGADCNIQDNDGLTVLYHTIINMHFNSNIH